MYNEGWSGFFCSSWDISGFFFHISLFLVLYSHSVKKSQFWHDSVCVIPPPLIWIPPLPRSECTELCLFCVLLPVRLTPEIKRVICSQEQKQITPSSPSKGYWELHLLKMWLGISPSPLLINFPLVMRDGRQTDTFVSCILTINTAKTVCNILKRCPLL